MAKKRLLGVAVLVMAIGAGPVALVACSGVSGGAGAPGNEAEAGASGATLPEGGDARASDRSSPPSDAGPTGRVDGGSDAGVDGGSAGVDGGRDAGVEGGDDGGSATSCSCDPATQYCLHGDFTLEGATDVERCEPALGDCFDCSCYSQVGLCIEEALPKACKKTETGLIVVDCTEIP